MPNYDFTSSLSALDFELLCKDLLEAELGIRFENFSEGRDKGIDLRHAPARRSNTSLSQLRQRLGAAPEIIVQCKRYSKFSDLKSCIKNKELPKVRKLNPGRYILTTSVSLSPQQADELQSTLSPYVGTTDDIYGRERLNALLTKHGEIERRHIKLWLSSAGVLDSIINAGTYSVSKEEVERTIAAARLYVKNPSFDEALRILEKHHVCIISGLPGIGKTTLARLLLIYYHTKDFDVLKIESDISEARRIPYNKKPRFYYYDDFLGQTAQADKLNKNEDQKLLDFMRSIHDSPHSVFVLTTREYILNQAKLHYEKLAREKLDYRTCIIDLASYSRRIRAEILYNHLHFSRLSPAHVHALTSQRGYLKIVDHENYNPRLIEYMTDPDWIGKVAAPDYPAFFVKNLDNPTLIWEHAFDQQIADSSRDLLLTLATLPPEIRMEDAEHAFSIFHTKQGHVHPIARRRDDFTRSLKELDGTFISNRRVRDQVLLRFQNPSIRDFMRGRVLNAPLLEDVLASCVFFEQALWFARILFDESRYVPRHVAAAKAAEVTRRLQNLLDAPSCTLVIHRDTRGEKATVPAAYKAVRLGEIVSFAGISEQPGEHNFIDAQLAELSQGLVNNQINPRSCLVAIEPLRALGLLSQRQGAEFIEALKNRTARPAELEEFLVLAELVPLISEDFGPADLQIIRDSWLKFVEQFASDYADSGVENPDDIREDSTTLETISQVFAVDTSYYETQIHEYAVKLEEELEEQRGDRWDSGEYYGDGRTQADCNDRELDSMFGTLLE